jgi:hypothetical protein
MGIIEINHMGKLVSMNIPVHPRKQVRVNIPVHPSPPVRYKKAQKKPLPKNRSIFTIAGKPRKVMCEKMGKNVQKCPKNEPNCPKSGRFICKKGGKMGKNVHEKSENQAGPIGNVHLARVPIR